MQNNHHEQLREKYGISGLTSSQWEIDVILTKLEQHERLTEQDIHFVQKSKVLLSEPFWMRYHEIEAAYYENQYQQDHDPVTLIQAAMHWQEKGNDKKAFQLSEQIDINRLSDKNLKKTLFTIRCIKYDIPLTKSYGPMLSPILQKLDQRTRLTAKDYAWLHEKNLLSFNIWKTYHEIEATWYEMQFRQQKKKNYWNVVNASSHWRGADEPEKALELTARLPLEEIKENKLKSALLTTRGGAFRDINNLKKAEKCAEQAMEFNPDTYQPYTLRGAICYDLKNFVDGDYWFDEAIKRGATPKDVDAELLRIMKRIANKEEPEALINHLLAKDPDRYAWVKRFRKNSSAKKSKKRSVSPAKNKARKAKTKK